MAGGSRRPLDEPKESVMTKTFKVMRQHEGDRFYKEGETRELAVSDAAHLVRLGVLAEIDATADDKKLDGVEGNQKKADPKLANKAEPALKNK